MAGNTVLRANWDELLEPGLKAIATDVFKEQPKVRPMLYDVKSSKKYQEHELTVVGLDQWESFNGTMPMGEITQGDKKTFTTARYAKAVDIERDLVRDDQYSTVKKMVSNLAKGAAYKMEVDAALKKIGCSFINPSQYSELLTSNVEDNAELNLIAISDERPSTYAVPMWNEAGSLAA